MYFLVQTQASFSNDCSMLFFCDSLFFIASVLQMIMMFLLDSLWAAIIFSCSFIFLFMFCTIFTLVLLFCFIVFCFDLIISFLLCLTDTDWILLSTFFFEILIKLLRAFAYDVDSVKTSLLLIMFCTMLIKSFNWCAMLKRMTLMFTFFKMFFSLRVLFLTCCHASLICTNRSLFYR